ncbi:hypothetical protein OXX80_001069 [Metschnikowia pulcherrima]
MGNEVSPTGSSSKTKKIKEVKVTSFEELESLATGQKEKPSEEHSEETQEEPVYGPERKYASMGEYQRDMGRKLFLEGKACLSDDQSEILAKEDWKVEWISGKERGLKIDIDLSNNFMDRFITKKQQIMGQLPFYRGQTMFFFVKMASFGLVMWISSTGLSSRKVPSRGPKKPSGCSFEFTTGTKTVSPNLAR